MEQDWSIARKDITGAKVTLGAGLIYNGNAQTQTIASVTVDGLTVTYDVTGNTGTDAMGYTMTLTGTGNFTGGVEQGWSIARKDISGAKVTLGEALTYNGNAQTQTIASVTVDGLTVTYDVTGNVGTDAKGYTMTLTGTGNFTGTVEQDWSIGRKDISGAKVTLGDSLTYNGNAQTQTIASVTVDGLTVTYDVTGNVGTDAMGYTMTLTGTGNFTGSVEQDWSIARKAVTATVTVPGSYLYTGSAIEPTVVVKDGDTVIPAAEYDVHYADNLNAGTASVTVTDRAGGNYQVSGSGSFVIGKAAQTITAADVTGTYGETGKTVTHSGSVGAVTYSSSDESIVTVDADGALTFHKAGSAEIVIRAAGDENHQAGTKSVTVTVAKRTLTFTALDKIAFVGMNLPDLSKPEEGKDYTVSGLLEGDELSAAVTVRLSYPVQPDLSLEGEWDIAVSFAGEDARYALAGVSGKLLVQMFNLPSGSGYEVHIAETTGGSVSTDRSSGSKGSAVTITAVADAGYRLESLTVTDSEGNELALTDRGNNHWSFRLPESDVTVTAVFRRINPYVDVTEDDWFYDAALWAYENDIVKGYGSSDIFAPYANCTRGQIVTFLWRAAGSPAPATANPFRDVKEGDWYYEAVLWAFEKGITRGYGSSDLFAPDEVCTRAQTVTFLWRAADAEAGKSSFTDVPADAFYASAVGWAAENGVTKGIGGGKFGPDLDCIRAQIVAFLYRLYGGK